MDKNPGGVPFLADFPGPINSILCRSAFAKEVMVHKTISGCGMPAILLDFDLLYTGYVKAGIIEEPPNLTIRSPSRDNWQSVLGGVVAEASSRPVVVVVDSLNGFFSIFGDKDSGRYANACMMMLASCVCNARGKIFLGSVARLREDEGWVLHPTGRRVLENPAIAKFFVTAQDGQPGGVPAIRAEPLSAQNGAGGRTLSL